MPMLNFLADKTYIDANGQQQVDQHIFDEILKMIDEAKPQLWWICSYLIQK